MEKKKFIIILGNNFSGTTTYLRIFNTIDGCVINGETWGFYSLIYFYERAKIIEKFEQEKFVNQHNISCKILDNYTVNSKKPAFFNTFDFNSIKKKIKELIYEFLNKDNKNFFGIKELYCGHTRPTGAPTGPILENLKYLELLMELFEDEVDFKILFIVRYKDKHGREKISKEYLNNIETFYNKYKKNTYKIYFNDLFDPELTNIREAFKFIKNDLDIDENKIKSIINNNLETF